MKPNHTANIAVGIVLVAAAIVYSACYAYFRLYLIDYWQRILLVVLWALVALGMACNFVTRSRAREELIRRYYFSRDWIYNHEMGYAPLAQAIPDGDAFEFVTFAADSLVEMSYGFEVADAPKDFEPQYLVSTDTFQVRHTGDGAVVKQWKGSLQSVVSDSEGHRGTYELGTFDNPAELVQLLEQNGALR